MVEMTLWNDNLLIGVKEIDDQHKKLIKAIDDLMDACFKGQGTDVIKKTLDFVQSYTKQHFSDEERLHAQNGYPQAAAHKQAHQQFIVRLNALVDNFNKQGATSSLSIELNKVLVEWLTKHISGEDKKYAAYVNSKK